jgi:HD-like signal output (HDOD) protein
VDQTDVTAIVIPLSASQTLTRARSLLESGRGAALPELLKLIETLSLNVSEVTIPELAELIEKDAVILAKVLSVANMLANNPGMAPMTTLTQAIHQIGYNRIRTIAVSLMLLETVGSNCPIEQTEAVGYALCAGLLAQGTAEELGTHDGELVFACATLRCFGRILMATVSPEHMREAQKLVPEYTLPVAISRMYGLTSLELSRELFSTSRLPKEMLRTFRDCEPEAMNSGSANYDSHLLGITDFACRLSELALDSRDDADAFNRKSNVLTRRFGRLIPGAEEMTAPLLTRADDRLRSFSRCHGTRALPAMGLNRIRQRLERMQPEADFEPASDASSAPHVDQPAGPRSPANDALSATAETAMWEAALEKSGAFDVVAPTRDVDQRIDSLNLIGESLKFDTGWLFELTLDGKGFTRTTSVGDHARAGTVEAVYVRSTERTVFGVCLQRREVVVLHDTADRTITRYLPEWWHDIAHAPKALALIPIQRAGKVHALVLAGWRTPRRVSLTESQVAQAQDACLRAIESVGARALTSRSR